MARAPKNTKQSEREQKLRSMFQRLHRAWGPQHWWPADSRFEMIVGAYLTQNTAWKNVELALARLRAANALTIEGIRRTPISDLEELVRPAGYFRQKAARLKQFVAHLDANYARSSTDESTLGAPFLPAVGRSGSVALGAAGVHPYRAVAIEPALSEVDRVGNDSGDPTVGDVSNSDRDERALTAMLSRPTDELRAELMALNGVGPETADSILLYAGLHSIFVVDAYTKRIFSRHALVWEDAKYEDIRALVESAFRNEHSAAVASDCAPQSGEEVFRPPVHTPSALSRLDRSDTAKVFGEFHGLLVQVGKHFCVKQKPRCEQCPLRDSLPRPFKHTTNA